MDVDWLLREESKRQLDEYKKAEKEIEENRDNRTRARHTMKLLKEILNTPGTLTKEGKKLVNGMSVDACFSLMDSDEPYLSTT